MPQAAILVLGQPKIIPYIIKLFLFLKFSLFNFCLGDNDSGKTTLVARLQRVEDPKKGSGLEYHYLEVNPDFRDGDYYIYFVFFYFCVVKVFFTFFHCKSFLLLHCESFCLFIKVCTLISWAALYQMLYLANQPGWVYGF